MSTEGISEDRRTVDVWITLEMPEALQAMNKDVALSFHSPSISADSRATSTPWTNVVRRVGTDDMFGFRMRVPATGYVLLHAVVIVDEPGFEGETALRRHLGFSNLFIDGSETRVTLSVSLFERFTLVSPTPPALARMAA